jgi:hypothetical protein
MAITSEFSSVEYLGNDAATEFPVPFRFLSADHLALTLTDALGVAKTLIRGVDYVVGGAGTATGSVTLGTAPEDGSTLLIERTLPITQPVALRTQGTFSPAVLEDELDRGAMIDQELARRLARLEDGGITGDFVAGAGLVNDGGTVSVGQGGGIVVSENAVAVSYGTAPPAVAATGAAGTGTPVSRADHTHAHGNHLGGALHAVATTGANGFMSAADKSKLDSLSAGGGAGVLFAEDQTSDAAPLDMASLELAQGTVVSMSLLVAAVAADGEAAATWMIGVSARRIAGAGASLIGTTADLFSEAAGATWAAAIAVDAGAVVVRVTGSAGQEVSWACRGRYVVAAL